MNISVVKKEIKENFFAMKGSLWLFVVTLLFSGMAYSFVTVKELSLLAQTEIMMTMGKLILGLGLLITIILASVSFSSEKEQSTIESLLLTPVSRMELAWGKLFSTLFMWILVFVLSIPYIYTLGYGTNMAFAMLTFIFTAGTLIIFLFSCISIGLSIILGSSKNAMITSIIIFLISAIPSFLSTTMKKAGFGMTIEKLSPLSNVINIMKEIIINKQGLLELSSLLIPFLIWIAAGYMFLRYAVNKLEFKGGE